MTTCTRCQLGQGRPCPCRDPIRAQRTAPTWFVAAVAVLCAVAVVGCGLWGVGL